ncbi:hypothetical protein PHYBLDRAFT_147141 [Phycomyces blakesleeanus NRRL 1555(-)]|uniref:Uncharacterized protein n=1 Tax=Phycomyces blakesleeanus (strain ATCC 8743b / DSM 1359 / FGSC 10004 / NBRC 33097 / NRRL 1555) TaxID=763407 RepID=A0A167M922_PHYB8|nr:hypothetical protein PHYBLDRAFT_147141 [Phycomyces blakesleeanus NRRL 1555(-)]OAD72164.1 hypothetical protein PHYBLDRAFT_147141 [Phycomyces blakesleeanus NRRL 1555(-)]|eukprot:XP_018290204.1 hypothetical protein PHYBLDRAFT_147141 [Phycomyces blakesleeanus NRRL 1555(-)]
MTLLNNQVYEYLLNIQVKALNSDILICSGLVSKPDHKKDFQFLASRHLESFATNEEKSKWAKIMRSAITKSLIFQGFPTCIHKIINASSDLYEILTPEVKAILKTEVDIYYRNDTTMEELYEKGYGVFKNVYKERSNSVATYMTEQNHDLFNHCLYMYAVVIGNYTHLSVLETHYVMLENHLKNFIDLGGTEEELKDINTIVEAIKAL